MSGSGVSVADTCEVPVSRVLELLHSTTEEEEDQEAIASEMSVPTRSEDHVTSNFSVSSLLSDPYYYSFPPNNDDVTRLHESSAFSATNTNIQGYCLNASWVMPRMDRVESKCTSGVGVTPWSKTDNRLVYNFCEQRGDVDHSRATTNFRISSHFNTATGVERSFLPQSALERPHLQRLEDLKPLGGAASRSPDRCDVTHNVHAKSSNRVSQHSTCSTSVQESGHVTQYDVQSERGTRVKQKRRRVLFSKAQVSKLMTQYERQRYLSASEREQLANSLNLSPGQIKIWFQNHRYKLKKLAEDVQPQQSVAGSTPDVQMMTCLPEQTGKAKMSGFPSPDSTNTAGVPPGPPAPGIIQSMSFYNSLVDLQNPVSFNGVNIVRLPSIIDTSIPSTRFPNLLPDIPLPPFRTGFHPVSSSSTFKGNEVDMGYEELKKSQTVIGPTSSMESTVMTYPSSLWQTASNNSWYP